MKIRAETSADSEAIHALLIEAFGSPVEAELVQALRRDGDAVIGLVAEVEREVAGHVLLSRMIAPFRALGLAPVAVAERFRRRGIAAALITHALEQSAGKGWEAVFVLGDPAYYGRFGFSAEDAAGFSTPYAGPYLMVRALGHALPVRTGRIDYAPAFAGLA